MVIEFYCSQVKFLPHTYDVYVGRDGTVTYREKIPRQKGVLRVIVESNLTRQPSLQIQTMFKLIYNHQMVTVVFYGFEQNGKPN